MPYFRDLSLNFTVLMDWMDVKKEQGVELSALEKAISEFIKETTSKVENLSSDKYNEPDSLEAIKEARPQGPRVLNYDLTDEKLYDKMLGAWLGRSAGCVLGIPVEGRGKEFIEEWAKKYGQPYPLSEYFKDYVGVTRIHYAEPIECFIKDNIDHVGTDDDTVYSVLGLLVLEEYGIDFTPENVGEAWVKYLPKACTAEKVALENLKEGIKPPQTALKNNPYYEWIGADIRSDPWGYCAPGLPEMAAEFAWRDAVVSHVKNGTYGEMFFSAAIAAAFVVDDIKEILNIALSEIPADSRMTKTVKQTIEWCETDGDWETTHKRIIEEYAGMSTVHTLNNAALTIAGLLYGGGDFEKTISLTVMGGYDTDCTGATAGSIVGAILGAKNLPAKWIEPFNDKLSTYLTGHEKQHISDLAKRCCDVAKKVHEKAAKA